MEKRNGLGKRNRGMVEISMAAIMVIAISLIVVIVLMNKDGASVQQGTSARPDPEVRQDTDAQDEATTGDGWTEYIYVTKWQDERGMYYDTKEECLRNSVSGECKEKKVLDHAIWHEAE